MKQILKNNMPLNNSLILEVNRDNVKLKKK